MGMNESKQSIMPGTFPGDADRPQRESCGSGSSDTGSLVAQVAGQFNRSVTTSKIDNDTKLSAEKLHPFAFRFPTAVDIKKIWEDIELKKNRLQGFDALQIMSDLSLLEHANLPKEAILSCSIMDQVRDLQTHLNENIAAKASVVLQRLASIISPKPDPRPATTFNKTVWENTVWDLSLSVPISQKIVDTPTLFRGGASGDTMNAVSSAQLPHVPPIAISSEIPHTLAGTKSPGLFSGFVGPREKLPVRWTNPPQEIGAFAQTTSQLPASSFAFPPTNTAKISLFGSRPAATDKGLFSSLSLERPTEQSVSQSTYNKSLFINPNDGKTQQGLFGSSTLSPGAVIPQNPMEQKSSVKNMVPDNDDTSDLVENTAPDVSKPSDAKASPDSWVIPNINTYEDLAEYLKSCIELDERRIPPWRDDLNRLWKEVTSVIDDIYNKGRDVGSRVILETSSKKGQLDKLRNKGTVSYAGFQEGLEEETEERNLLEHQHNKEQSRSTLVGLMCVLLQKIVALDKQNIAKYQACIEEMKQDTKATKARLVSTERDLEITSNKLSTVGEQLEKAEKEKIGLKNREKDLDHKFRKDMDRIIQKHAASSEEVRAQVSRQVSTKSFELAKTMGKVEDLQRQLKSLEQEKQHLSSAKITLDKECQDLKAKVENLRSYGEGYIQFKHQLEELQASYNDAIFERDDLQHRLNAITTAENDKPKLEPKLNSSISIPAAPRRDSQNPTTDSDHLDGVIEHWKNALKVKLASMTKTKEDITVLDAEIQKAQLALSPRLASRPLAVPPAQIVARHGFLDTGMEPLPRSEGAPANRVVNNTNHTWSSVVKRKPAV
ncbi:hypothetical protein CFE70_003235 [Pyrenophora teres f. teres 0-1]